MSETNITQKRVVYELPGIDAVTVRRDVVFRGAGANPLTMDLHDPPESAEAHTPAHPGAAHAIDRETRRDSI